MRQQLAPWRTWKPWLGFAGISIAHTAGLFFFSMWFLSVFDLYFWLFDDYEHFDKAMLEETGITLQKGIPTLIRHGALLLVWFWTAGFAFGSLSRSAICSSTALILAFAMFVIFGLYGA